MGQTGRVTPLVTVTEDREEAAPPFVVTSGHSPGLWFSQSLVSAWLLGSFSSLGLPSSSILRNDTNYRFPRSTAVPNKFLCDHFMLSCMLKNSSTVLNVRHSAAWLLPPMYWWKNRLHNKPQHFHCFGIGPFNTPQDVSTDLECMYPFNPKSWRWCWCRRLDLISCLQMRSHVKERTWHRFRGSKKEKKKKRQHEWEWKKRTKAYAKVMSLSSSRENGENKSKQKKGQLNNDQFSYRNINWLTFFPLSCFRC